MDKLLIERNLSPVLSRILERMHELDKSNTRLNYIVDPNCVYSVYKNVHYVTFKNIAMGDADWSEPSHKCSECITIETISDVVTILKPWLIQKGLTARLYLTMGGLRWFITSKRLTPKEADQIGFFSELPVDPLYASLAMAINPWKKVRTSYIDRFSLGVVQSKQLEEFEEAWASRISPKVGRENDFVAFHIATFGEVAEDREILEELYQFHDKPIRKSWNKESLEKAREVYISKLK